WRSGALPFRTCGSGSIRSKQKGAFGAPFCFRRSGCCALVALLGRLFLKLFSLFFLCRLCGLFFLFLFGVHCLSH
ncbi:MAG: hypothetical protein AVDCRST_MAG56-4490, partial [uncultured Cytophagales bacterium]